MSYSRFSAVDFGTSRAGLTTVGYRLYDPLSGLGSRVTAGVAEIIDGKYGAVVTYPDALKGAEVWDSGEGSPIYALNIINPPAAADNAAIADAVWDEAIAGHLGAGSVGAKLNAAGGAADPWATSLPGAYPAGQAGAIIGRFNIAPASSPLSVVPGAPSDVTLCRVYGYLETLENQPVSGVAISFKLITPTDVRSERMISGRIVQATTDAQGRITNKNGDPYVDLQRNDHLTPAGTKYQVNCAALGLKNVEVTLTTDLFDLSSILP